MHNRDNPLRRAGAAIRVVRRVALPPKRCFVSDITPECRYACAVGASPVVPDLRPLLDLGRGRLSAPPAHLLRARQVTAAAALLVLLALAAFGSLVLAAAGQLEEPPPAEPPRSPARGCLHGVALGLICWMAIGLFLWWCFR
jgi:hypothetical protein